MFVHSDIARAVDSDGRRSVETNTDLVAKNQCVCVCSHETCFGRP